MTDTLAFSVSKLSTLTGLKSPVIKDIHATLSEDAGLEELIASFVNHVRGGQEKPAEDSTDARLPAGVYSINGLHNLFLRDRVTIEKLLRQERIQPSFTQARKDGVAAVKGFRLTDTGKSGLTVRQVLEADADPRLLDEKILSLRATRLNKELDYEERTGVIRAQILKEFQEEATKLIKWIHTRARTYWRENGKRLRQCKSTTDLQRTGETDWDLIFTELKRDYPELLR